MCVIEYIMASAFCPSFNEVSRNLLIFDLKTKQIN